MAAWKLNALKSAPVDIYAAINPSQIIWASAFVRQLSSANEAGPMYDWGEPSFIK